MIGREKEANIEKIVHALKAVCPLIWVYIVVRDQSIHTATIYTVCR